MTVYSESDTEATTSDPALPDYISSKAAATTASEITDTETDSSSLFSIKDTHKTVVIDDIKMTDDVIEVTVSTDDRPEEESHLHEDSHSVIEGKLIETESGTQIVMLKSESRHSVCVCDPILDENDLLIKNKHSQTKPKASVPKRTKTVSKENIKPDNLSRKSRPNYQSKYDHIESKVKKDFQTPMVRRSKKTPAPDSNIPLPSTSRLTTSPLKHSLLEKKSKSIDEHQQRTEPNASESKDTISKKSESKYSHKTRGYMASTLSRDMKLESVSKDLDIKSPKHVAKKQRSSERKIEYSSHLSSPKRKIGPTSTTTFRPEETEKSKTKQLSNLTKREPFKKKLSENESVKIIAPPVKRELSRSSETSKLKLIKKENKVKVSSLEHKKQDLTHVSSKVTENIGTSQSLHSKDPLSKQKRKGIDKTKQILAPAKRKEGEKSPQNYRSKTVSSTSSDKDTDSPPKNTKYKRRDSTKRSVGLIGIQKDLSTSAEDQDIKQTSSPKKCDTFDQTVHRTKTFSEDKSSEISKPTLRDTSVKELETSTHYTLLDSTSQVQSVSTDDPSKNVVRAASAPIGSSSMFIESDVQMSGRRGSGPTRGQISDRMIERYPSLERGKGPTSLPSSPSRMRNQGQCNSIQLLTSEVFTRTIDSTGIEVIFRQPNDVVRKPQKPEHFPSDTGETSMIDTTDSSLSDSVALPSSSSDHDLSVDTSYRLRTNISPGSPKFSRRSRESMSPKIRQSDIVECATVFEDETSDGLSLVRTSPNLPSFDKQPSTPTKLTDKSNINKTPTRSEDRLSPILDVHSTTPPRLKHKFVYASSDDEEPALGKTSLEEDPSTSQVVMEPSSEHSMLLPSEIPRKSAPSLSNINIDFSPLVSELDLPLGIIDEIVSAQAFEEDFLNEELTTLSTTPSDIDYALLESNRLKISSEEEATDEDPEIIPKDDSFREEAINIQSESITLESFTSLKENMAGEESSIPLISITNTDDTITTEMNKNPYQVAMEPLTDVEDLDHDPDQKQIRNLKIKINDDDGGLTDAEIMEASDDEKDVDLPKISIQLDDIIDHSGTYEEFVRMSTHKSKNSKSDVQSSVSTSNTAQLGDFLKTFYEKDGTTDCEDVDLSDEEDNVDDNSENTENDDILQRLVDEGTVSISDSVKRSPLPSPCVTPEPGEKRKKGKGVKRITSGSKKKTDSNLLSPRSLSPHLSDITDTEIVYSDSDDEGIVKERSLSPQERRRRLKQSKENGSDKRRQKELRKSDILPELEISSVHISEKVPVKELVSESDTDNANYAHYKHAIYAPKKKTLLMEVAGALMKETLVSTDVEHFEGSNESEDDAASQFSDDRYSGPENQISSIKEKEVSKNALSLPKQDKVVLTDTEDIETEEEFSKGATASKPTINVLSAGESTEEDDFETTDNEYLTAVKEMRARAWKDSNYEIHFIEIDGKTRPLAITPDLPRSSLSQPTTQGWSLLTDVEDLADSDIETTKSFLPVSSSLMAFDAGVTDTEMVEGDDEIYRPKSPEPSDDENSQALPEPVREMILMKEDPSGRPVSVVLPLGNVQPDGLKPPYLELEAGLSEVEDMVTDDDDIINPSSVHDLAPTPDLPEIDGGTVHFSEVMKVQKKKLKIPGQDIQEPLTDTEDLFLSVGGKRKRSKPKLKLGLQPNSNNIRQDLTDTEEIVLSDVDGRHKTSLTIPPSDIEPGTDIDDVELSGEDDIHESQRHMAVTPDHLRELGDSYITLKESSGPFSEEAKQSFLELHKIPIINTISPSPDIPFAINTDTEDMFTSADEEGFSRAETMTPYDGAMELEDHSSVVYMKHTRKFDLDAPEEAMHIKGGIDIQETLTDVEDLGVSEDERPKPPDQLFVNDTADQVCVCLSTEVNDEDSVCVCVSKDHGGLSLVWNSKNSTDAKQQRDWAEKGRPDSTIDASNKETDEALLDLAAGLQDNKGTSSGVGPSNSK